MKFDINTLKRATCAVIAACVLLLGTWTAAQAQRLYKPYYGGPRNYGQLRRAQNRYRRERRQDLQRHQRDERSDLRDRLYTERGIYGNNHDWRRFRKDERKELKRHQKYERQQFKQQFKNRRSY